MVLRHPNQTAPPMASFKAADPFDEKKGVAPTVACVLVLNVFLERSARCENLGFIGSTMIMESWTSAIPGMLQGAH